MDMASIWSSKDDWGAGQNRWDGVGNVWRKLKGEMFHLCADRTQLSLLGV